MAIDEPVAGSSAPVVIGATLFRDVVAVEPRDSFQPNDLPKIDESLHSPKVIASLQQRALKLD
jgi:hypothetical protein